MTMDELQIISRLKRGNYDALKLLMEQYQDYVYSLARRIVKNPEIAEELTQDVFIKVYQKVNTYQYQSKFSTWLYTIAYRTCLNYTGKKKIIFTEGELSSQTAMDKNTESYLSQIDYNSSKKTDQLDVPDSETKEILWNAIDSLNIQQGLVITLFYLQELSISEIAGLMQAPVNTIKTHLHRGRRNLKEVLLKQYVSEDLL